MVNPQLRYRLRIENDNDQEFLDWLTNDYRFRYIAYSYSLENGIYGFNAYIVFNTKVRLNPIIRRFDFAYIYHPIGLSHHFNINRIKRGDHFNEEGVRPSSNNPNRIYDFLLPSIIEYHENQIFNDYLQKIN